MKLLVTGGAGFIGSAVIRHVLRNTDDSVVNVDRLTGDLHDSGDLFQEPTPDASSSPYSATKAGSDHLVRAWQRVRLRPAGLPRGVIDLLLGCVAATSWCRPFLRGTQP